jgi:hypothetical protein
MDLDQLGSALGKFFDGEDRMHGPSHDEITRAIVRTGLTTGDPRAEDPTVGKMKRVREVLAHASDHAPADGLRFALRLIRLLRAADRFEIDSSAFVGKERIGGLGRALESLGYALNNSGGVQQIVIDNLAGTELTTALSGYVNRINLNPDDAPLMLGTSKELDEATARHVLVERTGNYPVGGDAGGFPSTLWSAFSALGLSAPGKVTGLSKDATTQVDECLFLLAVAVNRLRNEQGTGHGRPHPPNVETARARAVARATALIAGTMLDAL